MELASIILLVLVAILLVVVLFRISQRQAPASEGNVMIQQQIDSLRDTLFQSLKITTDTVNQQLAVVTNQLANVTTQLQNNTGQIGTRLDNAANVVRDVQNKLGELSQATQEIKELGQGVSKLEEMLKAPKLRGGLGELLLEDVLRQVLHAGAYEIQYKFKRGQVVDAIIRTSDRIVPVDSKFPLENFQKMIEAKSDQEKKMSLRLFRSDVRKHVDSIAEKYIVPDEGTYDFALMYIPAENIYYETIIRDETLGEEDGLYSYALRKHVVPVSPNSFYAYLRVIELGLRGLQIERRAKEINEYLARLGGELRKFTDVFEILGTQLKNASSNYDKADKQLATFTDRLKAVQGSEPKPDQLDAFSP